jgi:hypothetical protein
MVFKYVSNDGDACFLQKTPSMPCRDGGIAQPRKHAGRAASCLA